MALTVSRKELLANGDDAMFRRVVHDALGFGARLQEIRDRFGEIIGLSGPAYSVLIAIEHLGEAEDVGVSRVSEHLHLSGAFVTIEVGKLVRKGLVDKRASERDRRRVVLTVTQLGRALLDELSPPQRSINDAIFDHFSRSEFREFARFIQWLVDDADRALALLKARKSGTGRPQKRLSRALSAQLKKDCHLA